MSVTFSVKNKKKMFGGYKKPLIIEEVLNLAPNLTQFSVDESAKDFNADEFYNSSVPSGDSCIILGVWEQSVRGFELWYNEEENDYCVRFATPCGQNDWKAGLEVLAALANKFDNQIIHEDGTKYHAQNIQSFDYEHDIKYGLSIVSQKLSDEQTLILEGALRPMMINKEITDKILSSDDVLGAFDEFALNTQYLDAYSAKQNFYLEKDSDEIFGVYTLTEGVKTILPYKPYVEWQHMSSLGERKVSRWELALVGVIGDENGSNDYGVLGAINYEEFIARLPKDSYEFIDANYFVVEPDRELLNILLQK